jgi:hypothetical protein
MLGAQPTSGSAEFISEQACNLAEIAVVARVHDLAQEAKIERSVVKTHCAPKR